MFSPFLKNLSNDIHIKLAWVFGIKENMIKKKDDKDIKFLR